MTGTFASVNLPALPAESAWDSASFYSAGVLRASGGLPALSIALSGENVILSWPSPSTGFVLEQTDSLNVIPASWSNTPGEISDNGLIKSLTTAHDVAKRLYRLRRL